MFRIVLFCEDKQLASVLHGLAGKVMQMEPPQPVVNAKAKGGKLQSETDGSVCELFLAEMKKQKKTTITRKDTRQFLEKIGRSPNSYGYVLKTLVAQGLLRKRGKGQLTFYDLIKTGGK